ncbi:helix-turn-helix transcriptional regulator [Hoeflea ulvae]|uniref:Helix-turn-helix domain-containing protein n=1 Tax=Hoeflea ulvae TaxID=2983764 RepID=A0ABT3YFE0_9HYPH|nr:helix-turn-helix domain-containing protein [Hoeflea ulvae]MCY0094610.1 helix-turn-helix domain-containing protein [Hoeflea ulvae]
MADIDRVIDPEYLKNLDIMDAKEAAVYLRSSPSTLAKLRCAGGGPVFIRQSARKTLYRRNDLDAWLAGKAHGSTSGYANEAGALA